MQTNYRNVFGLFQMVGILGVLGGIRVEIVGDWVESLDEICESKSGKKRRSSI